MIRWSLAVAVLALAAAAPAGAKGDGTYSTAFDSWRAADNGFAGWTLDGTAIAADGSLRLSGGTPGTDPYPAGGYYGGNYYNGGSFVVGEAVSPNVPTPFGFTEAIGSWNAETPAGTWIETQIATRIAGRWTKSYSLGIWASDDSTIRRHSVRLQGDTDGFVAVDTLILTGKKAPPADAYRLELRLFSSNGAVPSVRNASVAISTSAVKSPALQPGNPALWNDVISIPECSQMVYPDGGEVWCSPTSTSMVLSHWAAYSGPCEPRVRAAVAGVFDWVYDGHGNWPFNTAYAAIEGLEGYVARFTSFAQAEAWIAAGVPVVISFAWKKSDLDGAAIPSSNGHLAVLVGFDATGNPVVNDPAAADDASVTRTYDRAQLESLWLEHSGGTVYLIYPPGHAVPAL